MKNHRKLLLAGFAIVPLALSSWTSDETENDPATIIHQESNTGSTMENIGVTVLGKVSKLNTSKPGPSLSRLDIETVETKIVLPDDTITPTILSIEDIIKNYK